MKATLENRNGVSVVHITGALDYMALNPFKELLDPMVNQFNNRIVLDCERLSYADSQVMLLLCRYRRITSQNSTFLALAALSPRITHTLELLGIRNGFELFGTVDEALQATPPP